MEKTAIKQKENGVVKKQTLDEKIENVLDTGGA